MNSSPLPKVFDALASRVKTLQNAADLSNAARAALAVKGASLLATKISHRRESDPVETLNVVADASKVVDTVENPQERDYLRRILLDAGQTALNAAGVVTPSADATAAFDALLDSIDDADERQNALYVRFKSIVASLLLVEDYAQVRANLMARVEELDDLRQYEEILGYLYAADQLRGVAQDADDDELVTPTGLALQYDGALVELLASASVYPREILANASAKVVELLANLEKTFASGVLAFGDEDAELDEDELDELRDEVKSLAFRAPTILDHADVVLEFARQNDAFDAAASLLPLYASALAAPNSALYPLSATEYESSLERALDVASTLAKGNAKRLVRLADEAFRAQRFGTTLKELGKQSAREALAVMANPSRGGEFVEEYASLVKTHLDVGMLVPARKLAEKLINALDGFDFIAEHEFHTARFFNLFLALFKDDPEKIDAIVYKQESASGQQALEARVDVAETFANVGDDPAALDDALLAIVDRVFPDYNVAPDADPLLAADKLLAFAHDLAVYSISTRQ